MNEPQNFKVLSEKLLEKIGTLEETITKRDKTIKFYQAINSKPMTEVEAEKIIADLKAENERLKNGSQFRRSEMLEARLARMESALKNALGDLTIAINSSWKENRQEQWMNYLVNAKGVLESTTSPKSEVEP